MLTTAEENYLKCIYKLSLDSPNVSTSAIAAALNTSPASVSDMVKRLAEKKLLGYKKYYGARLTSEGSQLAKALVRKHRLWEVFLVDKLHLGWDQVHDIAEQLEHINSELLIERLDRYLDFPRYDPHGDPIPDPEGNFEKRKEKILADLKEGQKAVIVGVRDTSSAFLQYLSSVKLVLGVEVQMHQTINYDRSVMLYMGDGTLKTLSSQAARNIIVSPIEK